MDISFVHSDACLIKKSDKDYGAEFDVLKAENDKFLRLQESTKTGGLFGRPSFDQFTRENWIRSQMARDEAEWKTKEDQAKRKKTKEDTAELLVLQLKLVKVQLAYYKALGFE